jgi:endonuclease/exonuclease/phosphatase family metal-dependent hydrolase
MEWGPAVQLRVMSYNVRSLRDDDAAVARVIRAAQPDVVCIQEAPRFLRWRAKAASLSRRSGLLVVTGGRPASGNLILCTMGVQVLGSWDIRLSAEPGLHQRGAAAALLALRGARFAVAGTHLDLAGAPRVRHIGEIDAALAAVLPDDVPVIVAGDMNDTPGSAAWEALTAGRVDAAAAAAASGGGPAQDTFSAQNPRRRIDGVFADPRLAVRAARVVDSPDVRIASDHRPLVVDLELDAQP